MTKIFEIGDDVVTPLGRPATIKGFKEERLDLQYLDGKNDSVVLLPKLVKRPTKRQP